MQQSFTGISYIGGLIEFAKPVEQNATINQKTRRLLFSFKKMEANINFEDIEEIALDEKTTRSGGKAAAGAVIGRLLTGGIGLLAGAAIGSRKKDASTIFINHKKYCRPIDLLLKPKSKKGQWVSTR